MRDGGIGGVGLDNLISGVKNFLPAKKDFPITRLVEALMEPSAASSQALQDTDDYLLFDPKSGGRSTTTLKAGGGNVGSRQGFNEAVVFVVGGGSLVEYGNMNDWVARGGGGAQGSTMMNGTVSNVGNGNLNQKQITYGSTEILTPSEFVKALSELGGGGGGEGGEPSLI